MWFYDVVSERTTGSKIAEGGESKVYLSKDGRNVIKVSALTYFTSSEDLVYKYAVHNAIFKNTQYQIIGFAKDENGNTSVVLEQPYIHTTLKATQEQIDAHMLQYGFRKIDDGVYENDEFGLSDAVPKATGDNVLIDENGVLYFIDPYVYPARKNLENSAERSNFAENEQQYGTRTVDMQTLNEEIKSGIYEQVETLSGRIREGTAEIGRLNRQEEQGRIRGGSIAIQSTIIAGAAESANRARPGSFGESSATEQEDALIPMITNRQQRFFTFLYRFSC